MPHDVLSSQSRSLIRCPEGFSMVTHGHLIVLILLHDALLEICHPDSAFFTGPETFFLADKAVYRSNNTSTVRQSSTSRMPRANAGTRQQERNAGLSRKRLLRAVHALQIVTPHSNPAARLRLSHLRNHSMLSLRHQPHLWSSLQQLPALILM